MSHEDLIPTSELTTSHSGLKPTADISLCDAPVIENPAPFAATAGGMSAFGSKLAEALKPPALRASGDIALADAALSDAVGHSRYNLRSQSATTPVTTDSALSNATPTADTGLAAPPSSGESLTSKLGGLASKIPGASLVEHALGLTTDKAAEVQTNTVAAAQSMKDVAATKTSDLISAGKSAAESTVDSAKQKVDDMHRMTGNATAAARGTCHETSGVAANALHSLEARAAEAVEFAKRKAGESIEHAKSRFDGSVKVAKQKTGLVAPEFKDRSASTLESTKDTAADAKATLDAKYEQSKTAGAKNLQNAMDAAGGTAHLTKEKANQIKDDVKSVVTSKLSTGPDSAPVGVVNIDEEIIIV